jgi:2-polyprenyl-3-methyl-5-hydroxy-6-metoxy-1,4-benzoquinol methylase
MPDRARSWLLVPAGGGGEGMGHLARCLKLAAQLGPRVSFLVRHLDHAAEELLAQKLAAFSGESRPAVLSRIPAKRRWDLVIVDVRGLASGELAQLMRHGLVVCLDEGGEARDFAPFIVDTLPGLPGRPPANLADPAFLFLPRRARTRSPASVKKILLSLGGEDREHLAERLAAAIVSDEIVAPDGLTVVQGPLSGPRQWPGGVRVVDGADGLSGLLRSHDVLVTHFGMAAFEALAVGIPSILFNPSDYHARLGEAAGFPMIGVGRPRVDVLKALLADPASLYAHVQEFNRSVGTQRGGKLVQVLRPLTMIGSSRCPVCGSPGNRVVARFADRTYRRCAQCGIIGLESFSGRRKKYTSGYFSSEYRAQYGRTYLEDFEFIREASRPRLRIIRRLLGPAAAGTVVDVGCAYGPFLAAASDEGLSGFGLDVSPGAVAYVKKSLGQPAVCAPFESVQRSRLPRKISAVTLWYVIEHFPNTREVLARASALLPPGGVFAFSTPNGRGISSRKDLQAFLRASPGDHFTILSPRGLKGILAEHGLRLRQIRVTGHHPERFPGALGSAARKWPLAARILRAVSVLLGLGDTFEAYAVKRPT